MPGPIRISILADGGKAKQEFGGVAKSAESSFGKLGSIASKSAVPLAVAGGLLAAGFVKAFGDALDLQDAQAQLKAQLGLSDQDSEKAGKVAGDLYKNAFGDSIGAVNDVVATVFQSGLAKASDAEEQIKGVTEQVLNYSKISKEEALPVTRAVSQMLKTGLAKNATEAFDVLTRGQQLGINKSEDLLDTFNEYGTQFRKIGLDAPMALGLMNQALQAGARDSDVAADAIKEFSIRAVDGSKTTVDGFKSLGLNAKLMQEQIAKGGPAAAAGLDTVLDKLRAVKDPAERSRIAVELFGTQAEDLGAALFAIDPSSAVQGLGQLAGSAKRAGDTLNDTAKNKLTTLSRTIRMTLVEAIAKYALPKLEQFADWFNGPGKFVIIGWALDAGRALLDFADGTLGALDGLIGGLQKYGKVALIAAAGSVALINPGLAATFLKQADSMDTFGESARKGITEARTQLQSYSATLAKTKTRVEFEATTADLDAKIAAARKQLADPKLTATKRATLTADIAELERKKAAAVRALGDPALIKARTAKLDADKRSLDRQIASAKAALADPKLTAERKATLNANIANLLAQKKKAQAAIDALKGKTVPITVKLTYVGGALKGQPGDSSLGGLFPGKASGGSVRAGHTYWVGENGPELLTLGSMAGYITPNHKLAPSTLTNQTGGSGPAVINVYALADGPEVGKRVTDAIRQYERINGSGWRR